MSPVGFAGDEWEVAEDDASQHGAALWPCRAPAAAGGVVDHRPLAPVAAVLGEPLVVVWIVEPEPIEDVQPRGDHGVTSRSLRRRQWTATPSR